MKSKTENRTTTEISREAGVSVSSVSTFIKNCGIKPVKTGSHNRRYYAADDVAQILDHFKPKTKTENWHYGNSSDKGALIEQLRSENTMLREQLKIKDDQIAVANRLADQAQRLDLTHSTSDQPELLSEKKEPEKRGFWARVFGD